MGFQRALNLYRFYGFTLGEIPNFQTCQSKTAQVLPYHVIVMDPGTSAELHCDSNDLIPELSPAHAISAKNEPQVVVNN